MTDLIAAARAMIEPLTGYTPRPWRQGQNNPDRVSKGGEYISNCNPTHQSHPRTENNARLIAAAPDMRDMVATLADALAAERAKVAAAYEDACKRVHIPYDVQENDETREVVTWSRRAIRTLTPSDAQVALDKLLAEARLEGWRAGRDDAAEVAVSRYEAWSDEAWSDYDGCPVVCDVTACADVADAIRALPEPKEASHE